MTTPVGAATAYTDPTWNTTTNTATSSTPAAVNTTGDNTQLSSQAFLQLLVAQLQYQDPSQPMDTGTFMQETATLSQVQSTTTASANNTAMLSAVTAQTASSLVGKTITYSNSAGAISTGVVASANISTATPTLKIAGSNAVIDMSSVQEVVNPSTPSTAA